MTVCYSNLQKSFSYVNCTSSWIEPKSKTSNKRGVKQVPTLQYIALFKLFKLRPTFFTLALESTQTTWGLLEEWSSCITAWCGKCLTFPGVLKVSTFSITPFFSRSLITIKLSLFLLTILTHLLVFHSVFINKWVGFMHNTVFLCGLSNMANFVLGQDYSITTQIPKLQQLVPLHYLSLQTDKQHPNKYLLQSTKPFYFYIIHQQQTSIFWIPLNQM